ncbi:MAG: ASCH domain-containing protein [Rhizobiaceae bacterium]|nr:ASCH domain-containing protein [Rhizobiaceae bacterium]
MHTETALAPGALAFWQRYVANEIATGHPAPRLYDTMMIGGDAASADIGAQLILSGRKTTTSALPSDFDGSGQRPPRPGDLSLVLDGHDDPVCIVRTVSVKTQPFRDVDEAFALDYGEWDGTLATWRDRMLAHYADRLVENPLDTPLVCKRFTRVWPLPA